MLSFDIYEFLDAIKKMSQFDINIVTFQFDANDISSINYGNLL